MDDGVGAPEFQTVDATTDAELAEQVAEIEATEGPVTDVGEEVEVGLLAVNPNDPRYATTQQQKLALDQANFDDAWVNGEDGLGVVVAVVDTGVQATHPDLAANVLAGADFISTAPGGTACMDPNGHGSHVAGIIAQVDDSLGGIGGAPAAKILPVRVLNANGSGSSIDVADGITWAADHAAKVINLSLGGSSSPSINAALAYAVNTKQVTVVAAAGNGGTSGSPPLYPAALDSPTVIAVGALQTGTMAKASFSNNNTYIDIAAPGTQIDSTIPTSTYGTKDGTSMSTPFVSAVAALILRDCALSPAAVLSKIQSSATQAVSGFAGVVKLVDAAAASLGC